MLVRSVVLVMRAIFRICGKESKLARPTTSRKAGYAHRSDYNVDRLQ